MRRAGETGSSSVACAILLAAAGAAVTALDISEARMVRVRENLERKTALGLAPGQLYRHVRLSAARQRVEGSDDTIAEIALRCGYEDPAAMTRAFRRRFGCAPLQLRRQIAPIASHNRTEIAPEDQ